MSSDVWKDARTIKPVRVYDGSADGGAVTLFFDCVTEDNEEISATITLVQKDGTMREKAFRAASAILGCTPADFAWERVDGTDDSTVGIEVSVVQNGNFWNCHPRGEKKASVDPGDMKAKYGAKLRALFAGAPANTAKAPPRTTANNFQAGVSKAQPRTGHTAPPPSSPPPVQPEIPVNLPDSPYKDICTMQEAWREFCSAYGPDRPQSELNKRWFDCIQALTGGLRQSDCQPADWGKVKAGAAAWIDANTTPF